MNFQKWIATRRAFFHICCISAPLSSRKRARNRTCSCLKLSIRVEQTNLVSSVAAKGKSKAIPVCKGTRSERNKNPIYLSRNPLLLIKNEKSKDIGLIGYYALAHSEIGPIDITRGEFTQHATHTDLLLKQMRQLPFQLTCNYLIQLTTLTPLLLSLRSHFWLWVSTPSFRQ